MSTDLLERRPRRSLLVMPRLRMLALTACSLLAACGDAPSPRTTAANELLRTYADSVELGERIRTSRRKHPALTLNPHVGYRDSTYRSADGFGDLVVVLVGMPRTEGLEPSSLTRSLAIQLSTDSPDAVRRADQRIRTALGAPGEGCAGSQVDGLSRVVFWEHERGTVALVVPYGGWDYTITDRSGRTVRGTRRAFLVFQQADPSELMTWRRRCDAVVQAALSDTTRQPPTRTR